MRRELGMGAALERVQSEKENPGRAELRAGELSDGAGCGTRKKVELGRDQNTGGREIRAGAQGERRRGNHGRELELGRGEGLIWCSTGRLETRRLGIEDRKRLGVGCERMRTVETLGGGEDKREREISRGARMSWDDIFPFVFFLQTSHT